MHTVLKLAQLRWIGNVIIMPDERLLKKVFYGELQKGKRSQCGQKKRSKNTLKSLFEGFRHTNGVFGTDCTEAIKVARSHQQRSSSVKERESVKLKESAESAKPRPMGLQQIP